MKDEPGRAIITVTFVGVNQYIKTVLLIYSAFKMMVPTFQHMILPVLLIRDVDSLRLFKCNHYGCTKITGIEPLQ